MKQLECVRYEAKFDEYLKKLAKEAGAELTISEWNTEITAKSPMIVALDQDHLEDTKKLINIRTEKIIIALNARRDFKLVIELNEYLDKIFGFIDLSQEVNYNLPLLKNYSNMVSSANNVQLDKLADDMDKLYDYTKSELTRIKDLHDRLVKVRVDNLKGASITSKFMAGEKSGGEFFDLMQSEQQLLFLLAGTNNYIVSSMILAEMEVLKMSTPTTTLQSQREHFEKMINHHANENGADLSYCLATIDLKNLEAELIFKGKGVFNINGETHDFGASTKLKIRPGDKISFLSQGAIKNLEELNSKVSPAKFFNDHKEKKTKDLINEFFFEVSRNKPGNFLNSDAIMAVIEIEAKTLYKL
jgi:flagellin-specific chaperone FliS